MNGENGNRELEPPPYQRYLAIQDEAEWLRQYGLRGEPHYGSESYMNQYEAMQRVHAHQKYQEQIHNKFFQDISTSQRTAAQKRQANLDSWQDETIEILCTKAADLAQSDDPRTIRFNLRKLASQSDTVYTMAQARPHYSEQGEIFPLTLSLEDYSYEAVSAFLELLTNAPDPDDNCEAKVYPHEDFIVECCQLAHYLQCVPLLEDTLVPLLVQSVDSANCLSLCQLADQLSLPRLLEASLNHMMLSLASVEEHEIWGDLTPELQERIQTIQQILQSSNRRKVFFASFDEYLALFAEQVDYYRERLEDAQMQQERAEKDSPAWHYAQARIEEQRNRVRKLKQVLQQQKQLFRQKSS